MKYRQEFRMYQERVRRKQILDLKQEIREKDRTISRLQEKLRIASYGNIGELVALNRLYRKRLLKLGVDYAPSRAERMSLGELQRDAEKQRAIS